MDDISNIKKVLFLDIETVSSSPSFEELNERLKPLWEKKARFIDKELSSKDLFFEKAGIFAEFGKIVNISIGSFFHDSSSELCIKIKSFSGEDEKLLLSDFGQLINKFDQKKLILCAHNGKEFDFPYICRRMLINGIDIPYTLQFSGKSPGKYNILILLNFGNSGIRKIILLWTC